MYLQKCSLLDT